MVDSVAQRRPGHRRAKTHHIDLYENDLAKLHLEEDNNAPSANAEMYRRSSVRLRHLALVSSGGQQSSPAIRQMIQAAVERSGNPFYDVILKWDEIPVLSKGDFPVDPFMEAYKQILYVLDAFGAAFGIIKQDLKSQMAKTREQCTRHGVDTLQRMAERDGKNGKGTVALLWLKRTLQFTEVMLAHMLKGDPLPDAVDYAYHNTLMHAHPYVIRVIAKNIRFATPDTQTFLGRIFKEDTQIVCYGIGEFLIALRPRIADLVRFYNLKSYEDFEALRQFPPGYS